jgi:putative ABC transport system permease protein
MSMGTGAIAISNGQLAASASLILLNIVLSTVLRLGLGRSLLLASGRMVVQLQLIGQVLQWLFLQQNPGLILALSLLMALMASLAAVHRTRHRCPGHRSGDGRHHPGATLDHSAVLDSASGDGVG